jgi:hypothetical protein
VRPRHSRRCYRVNILFIAGELKAFRRTKFKNNRLILSPSITLSDFDSVGIHGYEFESMSGYAFV